MNTKLVNAILLASTLGFAAVSNASTINYNLESNNLSESGSLASVTLTDNGSNVDITVTALSPSVQVAGLGFSLNGLPGSITCSSLPTDYSCNASTSYTYTYDGSGKYADQADPSSFDTTTRYASFSFTLNGYNTGDFIANPQGNLFATHVYLDTGLTGFAFGGTPTVPVPAAAWLFASGLLGLVGVARRRRS